MVNSAPSMITPALTYFHRATSNLRASATIVDDVTGNILCGYDKFRHLLAVPRRQGRDQPFRLREFQRDKNRGKLGANSGRRLGPMSCNRHVDLQSEFFSETSLAERRSLFDLLMESMRSSTNLARMGARVSGKQPALPIGDAISTTSGRPKNPRSHTRRSSVSGSSMTSSARSPASLPIAPHHRAGPIRSSASSPC